MAAASAASWRLRAASRRASSSSCTLSRSNSADPTCTQRHERGRRGRLSPARKTARTTTEERKAARVPCHARVLAPPSHRHVACHGLALELHHDHRHPALGEAVLVPQLSREFGRHARRPRRFAPDLLVGNVWAVERAELRREVALPDAVHGLERRRHRVNVHQPPALLGRRWRRGAGSHGWRGGARGEGRGHAFHK